MADVTANLGRWHVPVILATFYRGVPSAMIVMMINFAAPRLDFWCRDAILADDEGAGPGAANATACWLTINGSRVRCTAWEFDHSNFQSTIIEDVSAGTRKAYYMQLIAAPFSDGFGCFLCSE